MSPVQPSIFSVKIAMDLYDRLANVTDSKYANYTLTKEEVLEREPQLQHENLTGGGVYLISATTMPV